MNTLWEYATDEDLIEQIRLILKEMKDTAESREKENPYSSISSDYRSK